MQVNLLYEYGGTIQAENLFPHFLRHSKYGCCKATFAETRVAGLYVRNNCSQSKHQISGQRFAKKSVQQIQILSVLVTLTYLEKVKTRAVQGRALLGQHLPGPLRECLREIGEGIHSWPRHLVRGAEELEDLEDHVNLGVTRLD